MAARVDLARCTWNPLTMQNSRDSEFARPRSTGARRRTSGKSQQFLSAAAEATPSGGYSHHVFISYSRSGDVPDWLNAHFLPVLINQLEKILNDEPQIFVDKNIDVGSDWPDGLAEALHRSCCMIAIWTPRYFRSKWCIAEWHTMLARQSAFKTRGHKPVPRLVYPIVFADGEHFPPQAQRIQSKRDLRNFAYPYEVFKKSEKYLEFHDLVTSIASDLAKLLKSVPPWEPGWETIRAGVEPGFEPSFPRF